MIYKIYVYGLGVSFLCSLISFRLHYAPHLKLYSIFLGIQLITEILADFWTRYFHFERNYLVYNVFLLVQCVVVALYFRMIIKNERMKRMISIILFVSPLFWIWTVKFVFDIQMDFDTYMVIFDDVFAIGLSVVYFYEIFVSEELIDLRGSPEFWIAAATIVYCCSEIPITGIFNFLTRNFGPQALWLETPLQILNILALIMIVYGYICPKLINITKS